MFNDKQLVLASASPRRRELLSSLGLQFKVVPPRINEEARPDLSPNEIVEHLAFLKANTVALVLENSIVIGADTLVFADGKIIGKPEDRADAIHILTQLSGTRHSVFTGICIIDTDTGKSLRGHEETVVQMRRISNAEIEEYVDTGGSTGKAGAYAIQEDDDKFVEEIEGSFSNVVGLPLDLLKELLDKI